jgi:hypothetical protein
VRRWARLAGYWALAEHSSELITHAPHANREEFLAQVDDLIAELDKVRLRRGANARADDEGEWTAAAPQSR